MVWFLLWVWEVLTSILGVPLFSILTVWILFFINDISQTCQSFLSLYTYLISFTTSSFSWCITHFYCSSTKFLSLHTKRTKNPYTSTDLTVSNETLYPEMKLSIQQYTVSYTSFQGRTKGTTKREETFFILSSCSVELAQAEKHSNRTAGSSTLPSQNLESPQKALSRQPAHQTETKIFTMRMFFQCTSEMRCFE